jgi:hypothetical protein
MVLPTSISQQAEIFPAAKVEELSNFLSIGVLLSYTVAAWPRGEHQ